MGKSATAKMFAEAGVPVFDSDGVVHKLQAKGGRALGPIEETFPGVVMDGELDRQKLGSFVFADKEAKAKLEAIVHPLVQEERIAFFEEAEADNTQMVVLDVPLLFETSGDKGCHKVVVVSAPKDIQRERVLARQGMTEEKFIHILKQQLDDSEKRDRADYIVETHKGFEYAENKVKAIIKEIEREYQNA